MSRAKHQLDDYEKAPSIINGECKGCAARFDAGLCCSLPPGCSVGDHIWVETKTSLQQYHAALEQDIG